MSGGLSYCIGYTGQRKKSSKINGTVEVIKHVYVFRLKLKLGPDLDFLSFVETFIKMSMQSKEMISVKTCKICSKFCVELYETFKVYLSCCSFCKCLLHYCV